PPPRPPVRDVGVCRRRSAPRCGRWPAPRAAVAAPPTPTHANARRGESTTLRWHHRRPPPPDRRHVPPATWPGCPSDGPRPPRPAPPPAPDTSPPTTTNVRARSTNRERGTPRATPPPHRPPHRRPPRRATHEQDDPAGR